MPTAVLNSKGESLVGTHLGLTGPKRKKTAGIDTSSLQRSRLAVRACVTSAVWLCLSPIREWVTMQESRALHLKMSDNAEKSDNLEAPVQNSAQNCVGSDNVEKPCDLE